MFLLVGLGNPGPEYEKNRHNIGFRVMDALADRWNAPLFRKKFSGDYTECMVNGIKCGLLKPLTFMNLSGQSVAAAMRFYKIPLENLIIFHDELDLVLRKVRTKTGGGAAGHNGLKSIDEHLGDQNYIRVRIGIDHPGDKDRVSGYVLSDFAKAEQESVEDIITAIAKHAEILLKNEYENFMTQVARDVPLKEKQEIKNGI